MILAYPFGAAANTFVIFGVACLVYGISELINWYKSVKDKRKRSTARFRTYGTPSEKSPYVLKEFPKVDWSEK